MDNDDREYPSKVSIHALVRVRLHVQEALHKPQCFNPRTRESATGLGNAHMPCVRVSIHALVRVRLSEQRFMAGQFQFQSTHS